MLRISTIASISHTKLPTESIIESTRGERLLTQHYIEEQDDNNRVKINYYYSEKYKLRFFIT